MAIKSTVYKIDLYLANMDQHYYHQHHLTLAKHPSETDERLMVRVLAFAMYADEALTFGKGISADNEATLWIKDLTGDVNLWVEIGQPDERIIRKACIRAKQVVLILYGAHTDLWWQHHHRTFTQRTNLTVIQLPYSETKAMAAMANRSMSLTCNIDQRQIMLINDEVTATINPIVLKSS